MRSPDLRETAVSGANTTVPTSNEQSFRAILDVQCSQDRVSICSSNSLLVDHVMTTNP